MKGKHNAACTSSEKECVCLKCAKDNCAENENECCMNAEHLKFDCGITDCPDYTPETDEG